MNVKQIREVIRDDKERNKHPRNRGFIFLFRWGSYFYQKGGIFLPLSLFFRLLIKLTINRNNHFPLQAQIGKGIRLPHRIGIVISGNAVIGERCTIFHQVTIGVNDLVSDAAPCIGDNCYIGAGAKIVGNVHIGNNVKIGANAVVTEDVPDDMTVVGYNKIVRRRNAVKETIVYRVLLIEATSSKGGIETFILNTCKYLDKDNYQITVLANCPECSIECELSEIGISIEHIRPAEQGLIAYYRDLKRVINTGGFDIVHINKNSLADPLTLLLCKKRRIPKIVLHSHNTHPTSRKISTLLHQVFRKLLVNKHIIKIACSQKAADWMFSNRSSDNCLLLKNGIETERYAFRQDIRECVRNALGVLPDELAICNVGRLCEQKNTLFLVEIMREIVKLHPAARLFLIGTGEMESAVREKVQELRLSEHVTFLGKRTDVNELLQGMDLFLMPSLHEGLPIAAIEAQAAGLPLLISDTVDQEVKLLESTESECLTSAPNVWASHCLKLVGANRRDDAYKRIKTAGYDICESVTRLENLYSK